MGHSSCPVHVSSDGESAQAGPAVGAALLAGRHSGA
jgi:hypothetical protein